MEKIPKWFSGVRINIIENLLFGPGKPDSKIAVTSIREGNTNVTHTSWGELRLIVGKLGSALRVHGIKKGDRVAVIASNSLNTLSIFLATVSIGAIFTSTSTDMGSKAILDRLSQIRPTLVFIEDFAVYGGKVTDLRPKAIELVEFLQKVQEFRQLVVMPRFDLVTDLSTIPRSASFEFFLSKGTETKPIFERAAFDQPCLILYSSGTTGQPKCIVHGAGGILLSQKKELFLHFEIGPESAQMIFTTTSWAMYNKSITSLLNGGRIVTYDGSPFYPDRKVLLRICEGQKLTHLGISPRYLDELQRHQINPRDIADLSSLRMVNVTGATLLPEQARWFYEKAFPSNVHLANSAGSTDTACQFAAQNAFLPVYPGELQSAALGMKLEVFEQSNNSDGEGAIQGKPAGADTAGELVITAPFPTMPIMFWGEGGAKRYHASYFATFEGVWTQGDFIKVHADTGGIEFLGRSDGVLNPSGVRFGSAEIYSVLQDFPQIADSICVGQRRRQDSDERVFLFILMRPGASFDAELVSDIKLAIRKRLSARHVPKYVFECKEIPMTLTNKKMELPVKRIISGNFDVSTSAIANPGSLKFFEQFSRIEELEARSNGSRGILARL
ncbi:acetoacetate-CoA ligase [Cladophialophora bantiana CBS 173.52]|uniref:Acetoacetate-CoA ligase n=1 Tax=Cladophialophora bantiana (strain ATCC 10958 / CBS 173.52 / CDC B-1940 / NIH 8579) TaxID=1442370 RepID=A0A0D2HWY8_CLAB1|nr:acetoacetate-CoA ligase [Cladophialophora bantiana CBS 173.52]KIW95435.1 acetoacetate-CoA ligase [Cladophialophora bantiana CBS 173.52]